MILVYVSKTTKSLRNIVLCLHNIYDKYIKMLPVLCTPCDITKFMSFQVLDFTDF